VQVDEPLEELEVSRRRGRVPVGREVEGSHEPPECTPSKSVDKLR
jgi:hypothetical protein